LNATAPKPSKAKQKDGFTSVTGRRKTPSKKQNQKSAPKGPSKNSFDALSQQPTEKDAQNSLQAPAQEKGKSHEEPYASHTKGTTHSSFSGREEDTNMLMDEMDLADIDLEKLEEELNQKYLQHLPVEQLRKVHKVFTNSSAGSTARLGIAPDPNHEPKKQTKESKRRGRKPAQQLIKEAGHLMINFGQIQRLSKGYLHPPPQSS